MNLKQSSGLVQFEVERDGLGDHSLKVPPSSGGGPLHERLQDFLHFCKDPANVVINGWSLDLLGQQKRGLGFPCAVIPHLSQLQRAVFQVGGDGVRFI